MGTQRPLREMAHDIAMYVQQNSDRVEFSNRLNLIDSGQLMGEIEKSLLNEFKPETVVKMIERVPAINLLTRIVDKLSRIYDEPISRSSGLDSDTSIIEFYETEMNIDSKLAWANRVYNLHETVALEPYLSMDSKPKIRVMSPDQFTVYSDDPTDPTNPTVFIKFMGDVESINKESRVNVNGIFTRPSEKSRVGLFYVYSDTEFMVMDSDGTLRPDHTPQANLDGLNPLGMLPIVYVNKSHSRLLPIPNDDMLSNTVLIPKLLGDLNYAVKYLAHSLVVVKDMDLPDEVDRNPDAIWVMKSSSAEDGVKGSVEVVTPKIDIDAVIKLIQTTLATWLESMGIRPGTMGNSTGSSRTSALAKIVDEADATASRNAQINKFIWAEKELFKIIAARNENWIKIADFEGTASLSSSFELNTVFPEQKIFSSEKEKIEKATMLISAGLATQRQAIRLIYPTMTEKELDEWVMELEEDEPSNTIQVEDGTDTQTGDQQKDPKSTGQGGGSPNGGTDSSTGQGSKA